jgi:hypothetical protein
MFLICGSGRSGTSAVARLLHEAGLPVGHDLIEPDEHNAEGYYEERQLVLINDAILNAAGLGPWFSVASREQVLQAAEQYGDYMRALVDEATPAWKDPRLSYTLEAWLPLLPESPRIIVCLRSAAEVVASTMRYYAQAGDEAEAAIKHVWRSEYERLIEIIDAYKLDAISIEYSRLHADPALAVEPLSRFVGRPLDPALVRRDLRHHSMEMPEDLRALYERVLALGA